jgi:hypothetical protein
MASERLDLDKLGKLRLWRCGSIERSEERAP